MSKVFSGLQRNSNGLAIWKPPAASVGVLAGLFGIATAARHSPFAEAGRSVMTIVSTVAAVAIAGYGIKMIVEARVRGLWSAVAGIVMVILGASTTLHVLK